MNFANQQATVVVVLSLTTRVDRKWFIFKWKLPWGTGKLNLLFMLSCRPQYKKRKKTVTSHTAGKALTCHLRNHETINGTLNGLVSYCRGNSFTYQAQSSPFPCHRHCCPFPDPTYNFVNLSMWQQSLALVLCSREFNYRKFSCAFLDLLFFSLPSSDSLFATCDNRSHGLIVVVKQLE